MGQRLSRCESLIRGKITQAVLGSGEILCGNDPYCFNLIKKGNPVTIVTDEAGMVHAFCSRDCFLIKATDVFEQGTHSGFDSARRVF